MAHEAVDTATSEDRRRVYEILRLRVVPHPDGTIEAKGEYVGGSNVRTAETTSLYKSRSTKHLEKVPHPADRRCARGALRADGSRLERRETLGTLEVTAVPEGASSR